MKTKFKKVKSIKGICLTKEGLFCCFLNPKKYCSGVFDLKTKKSASNICAEENVIFTR
jgi:hypothetical protein